MENKLKGGYVEDCIGDTDMQNEVELKKNYFGGYTFRFYVNPYSKRLGESKNTISVDINDNNAADTIRKKMDDIRFTIPEKCLRGNKNRQDRNGLKQLIIARMLYLLDVKKKEKAFAEKDMAFAEKDKDFESLQFKTCKLDPERPGYCATNNSTAAAAAGGRRKKSVRKSNRRARKSRKQRKSTRRVRS